MQKKIGIILVNYNGYEDTIECVKSIKKSTYRNYKIIIVDNASPDESGNRLNDKYSNDSDIVVILNKENTGFSEGNNIGLEYIEKEQIDYILMLNNDTVVEPEFLYKLIEGAKETNFEGLY
uniref:glycosyltransferase family 2 protein n=1 Tax=Blautia sp. TaxID=1955243 RepID=UPI00260C60D3